MKIVAESKRAAPGGVVLPFLRRQNNSYINEVVLSCLIETKVTANGIKLLKFI